MSGHLMATSVAGSMPQCAKAFSFGEYLGFSLAYYILLYIYICIHRVIENDIVGTSTINWDIKAV